MFNRVDTGMRCLLLVLLCFNFASVARANVEGPVIVLHGDTIQLGKLHIHLQGLASPPRGSLCTDASGQQHTCGDAAAQKLEMLIGSASVKCLGSEFNHQGHLRAMCYIGTKNLNGTMIRAGWALSEGRYGRWHESLERKAKAARVGLWADETGDHWTWDW